MINTGRGRWKIENEGFNNEKNGIYDIEPLNSRNGNAMKNHYFFDTDSRYHNADIFGMEPTGKRNQSEHKNTFVIYLILFFAAGMEGIS